MLRWWIGLAAVISSLASAHDIYHERVDGYVPVIAHAGFMGLDTQATLSRVECELANGQCVAVSANTQFVSEYGTQKMCCGWYLVAIAPNGQETWLVRTRGENILSQNQHYINAAVCGFFKADQEGLHAFEMRGYCGTFDLRKDGMISTTYNEIQILVFDE